MHNFYFIKLHLPDPRFVLVFIALFMASAYKMMGQCSVDIDFNTWSEVGLVENGEWLVEPNGSGVFQTTNGDPTFFMSPSNYMNVKISGTILVDENTSDDDYVGFVFSALNPLVGSNDPEVDLDLWLLDWKSGAQSSADEGFSLIRIQEDFDFSIDSSFMPYFWTHNSNNDFSIKEQVYGEGLGWVPGVEHDFELTLFSDRVTIIVDGNTVIDRSDCFNVGRFGFYNFSQENVYYSNFRYEIFSDFSVPDEVCEGESFSPNLLDSNCSNISENNLTSIFTNWFWQFGDDEYSFEMLPEHLYENDGSYEVTLTVTDALGCSAISSNTLTVQRKAEIEIFTESGCVGDELDFSASATSQSAPVLGYSWDFNNDGEIDYSGSSVSHVFNQPGEFPINVTAISSGCNDTIEFISAISSLPTAGFEMSNLSNRTVQFTNLSLNSTSYLWDFGDGSVSTEMDPLHIYDYDDSYTVTLNCYNQSCEDFTEQMVTVEYKDLSFIPTAFSPNGDGKNDEFRVLESNFTEAELVIFNHWGELIHSVQDSNASWNGTHNGELAASGNYTYMLTGTMLNGEKINYKGIVALIR